MIPINVTIEAFGQTLRVVGMFTPGRPAITSGPPDNWEPADPAEWGEHSVTLDGSDTDLTELLERVRVPGRVESALEHVRELAELQWLRDQDDLRRAA